MKSITHAVGAIFEDENGYVLVLLRNKKDPEGETWGLVGGKIDPGETKEQALVREAQEEIKYKINLAYLQFLKTFEWNRSDLNIIFELFRLKVKRDELTIILELNENTKYMWIQPKKAYKRKDLMIGLYPILEDTYSLK